MKDKLVEEVIWFENITQGPTLRKFKDKFTIDLIGVSAEFFRDPLMVLVRGEAVPKGEADLQAILDEVQKWLRGYGE